MRVAPALARTGLAAWLSLVGVSPAVAQVTLDRVVAVVGTTLVTLSDVRAARLLGLVPASPTTTDDEIARQLIDRELMRGEVARFATPEPSPTAIETKLAEVTGRLGDPAATERALAAAGLTAQRLRAWIAEDLRIAQHLDDRFTAAATLTDEDILRYYREHGDRFAVGGEVPPFEEVEQTVRVVATEERRRGLVDQWLGGLRRSATVRTPRR